MATGRSKPADDLDFQRILLEAQSEASTDGILAVSLDRRILYRNGRFLEMWGIPPELAETGSPEGASLAIRERLVADADGFRARNEWLYDHPEEEIRDELVLRDGRVFERHLAPIRGADGTVHGRVVFSRDVTERKRAEERVERAVRAREELLAVVSHDLRNPLNAMVVILELLLATEPTPQKRREHLVSLRRLTNRMGDLIQELLDAAAIESGGFAVDTAPESLASIVGEAVEAARPLGQDRSVTIAVDVPGDLPPILADRRRVSRVLLNLLSNAIRFSPAGAEVCVRAKRRDDHVSIAVEDQGPGIAVEEREQVFQRFWRSAKTPGSTGLRLAIARGLVEAHGGKIWIEESPSGGSCICFTLPLA